MTGPPQLGPVPQRIAVDTALVRHLIADQFPQWAGLPVEPVANGGWDNWTFHLGSTMSVRLPSAAEYALAVEKEHRWLPVLASGLPLPIPTPLGKGKPGPGYPFPWSIYAWLDGEPASPEGIVDPDRFACELAGFLSALQHINPAGGPRPGQHNWYRGGPLRTYDAQTRRALTALAGHIDVDLAAQIWQAALDAPWNGPQTWFHGDVAPGNLLLEKGNLVAVIDFGTCGIGDPACDLAIAWTLLTVEARHTYRDRLHVDEAMWARGRGWALWKALITYSRDLNGADEQALTAQRVLTAILAEYLTDDQH